MTTNILLIILRIIHIFSGIAWVGWGLFMLLFFVPTMQRLGPDGGKFMQNMLVHTQYALFLPLSAVLTVLSGIWMFIIVSSGFNVNWISQGQGIVLSLGALFGLLAFGHGLFTLRVYTIQMKNIASQILSSEGPPSPELVGQLPPLAAKIGINSRISMALVIIAVLGMASARYATF